MSGRILMIEFRGRPRQVEYLLGGTEPLKPVWWFRDDPMRKVITEAEWGAIDAICLADLCERRAAWIGLLHAHKADRRDGERRA